MFVSLPEYRLHVPAPLASPDASYWRSLALSTNAPWFVLNVRLKRPDTLIDTFLLAWDTDLIDAIKSSDVEVQSLLLVSRTNERSGWTPIEIQEIWEATDPEDESTSVLLVDAQAREYSGHFMQPAVNVRRIRMVAKIACRATKDTSADASH